MKKLAMLMMLAAIPVAADPVPTNITVRVIARDAKAIYNAVGGAWVTITDRGTGKVLAEGPHAGTSAGSTQKIMIDPRRRGETAFATPDAAKFETTLPLDRPTVVVIAARGPLHFPQAERSATKTLLLLPGEHITGEGVLLEIHGLIVVAKPPQTRGTMTDVEATVQMACGCPVEPEGIWNASEFQVTATLIGRNGKRGAALPMRWDEGRWIVSLPHPAAGPAAIEVIAAHTPTANFGVHKLELE
ncbi:MAG TPA: hypothetical protein VM779_06830 [Thermoanaerobaculia bacterium]|nr:hypothetical protein [Thermoanaerobaculia bacterium]